MSTEPNEREVLTESQIVALTTALRAQLITNPQVFYSGRVGGLFLKPDFIQACAGNLSRALGDFIDISTRDEFIVPVPSPSRRTLFDLVQALVQRGFSVTIAGEMNGKELFRESSNLDEQIEEGEKIKEVVFRLAYVGEKLFRIDWDFLPLVPLDVLVLLVANPEVFKTGRKVAVLFYDGDICAGLNTLTFNGWSVRLTVNPHDPTESCHPKIQDAIKALGGKYYIAGIRAKIGG